MQQCVSVLGLLISLCTSAGACAGGGHRNQQKELLELISACRNGHYHTVQSCLAKSPLLTRLAVDATSSDQGVTALSVAAAHGHIPIVRLLVEAGASSEGEDHAALFSPSAPRFVGLYNVDSAHHDKAKMEKPGVNSTDLHGRTPLYYAAKHGNTDILSLLILQGARVSGWMTADTDPLCIASVIGHTACVRQLLAAGAPIITTQYHRYNAVLLAALAGHADIITLLLEQGFALDTESPDGMTALMGAASEGHLSCIRTLLHAGANVNHQEPGGQTALYCATNHNHPEAVTLLLDRGAKVSSRSTEKNNPISVASLFGYTTCVQRLLAAGVCAGTAGDKSNALILAAYNGHADTLMLFLEQGYAVDLESADGETALMAAAEKGQLPCLQLLLQAGANIDQQDNSGRAALYFAASRGQDDAIGLLLKHGATVSGWSSSRTDPLCTASFNGYAACVRALLCAGAAVSGDRVCGYTVTALHLSAAEGQLETLKLLVNHCGSIDVHCCSDQTTPLLMASAAGHLPCIRVLLDAKANINHADLSGYTALHYAARHARTGVAKLLLERGACTDIRENGGKTPLALALEYGCEAIVAQLRQARGSLAGKDLCTQ